MEYRSLEHKIRDLWIAEANRNTEIRRKVKNVGRPKDNVKDETSKLGKQGEIKTKIIDEAADGDVGNKESDKKAKKDAEMDDMEAKTIKGGKTEVDINPKTDDSTENSTDEDKKSKKAANKENKQIGAKGVKEETMNSKLTLGSPESLINSIAEAMKSMKGICPKCKKAKCICEGWKEETELEEKLVGKQHKIDANHNGKIDAQDFKILKGKKKMEEEVEQIDELDREGMVKRYADKARRKVETGEESPEKRAAGRLMAGKKRWGGTGGIPAAKVPAVQREEVELSADELSRIEEIANNLDEVVTARKLTAADKAARAKYLEGHKAKVASYAPHEVKASAKSFKDRNTEVGDYSKEPSTMHKTGLINTLSKQDTKVTK
jgi:hypothetical protein